MKPRHQVVKVFPATERERVHGFGDEPLWCMIRGFRQGPWRKLKMSAHLGGSEDTLARIPITFKDGHPSDVVWSPSEAVFVTRLDFVFRGKVYSYPLLGNSSVIKKGQTLHLALGHLKLVDKFGTEVLTSG